MNDKPKKPFTPLQPRQIDVLARYGTVESTLPRRVPSPKQERRDTISFLLAVPIVLAWLGLVVLWTFLLRVPYEVFIKPILVMASGYPHAKGEIKNRKDLKAWGVSTLYPVFGPRQTAVLHRNGTQDIGNTVGFQDLGYRPIYSATVEREAKVACGRCSSQHSSDQFAESKNCRWCGNSLRVFGRVIL